MNHNLWCVHKAQVCCTGFFDPFVVLVTQITFRDKLAYWNYLHFCNSLNLKIRLIWWNYNISCSVALICCSVATFLTVWQQRFIELPLIDKLFLYYRVCSLQISPMHRGDTGRARLASRVKWLIALLHYITAEQRKGLGQLSLDKMQQFYAFNPFLSNVSSLKFLFIWNL